MTDDTPTPTPAQEDDALAAEMALGLLDGPEAQAATARMSADPAFAMAVRDWHERLAGLAMDLTPVMAPARARQAIRERLGHSLPPLANDPTAPRRSGWRGRVAGLGALAALAATLAFLWLPDMTPWPDADAPDYRAELSDQAQVPLITAHLSDRVIEVTRDDATAPQGRDWELWWIAPDGAAPVSLGVVPRDGPMRITLPDGLDPAPGVQLALSEEPQGGSPSGQPTGPVVAAADLTAL